MPAILDTYAKLTELKNNGVEIIELHHAFRLNGIVDLWKFHPVVFEIPINLETSFNDRTEAYNYAVKMLTVHEKRAAFKKTEKGRMAYQEFKHKKVSNVFESEYMHWKASGAKISEDHLYFVANEVGEVKIGRSKNPKQRLSDLKTGSATGLKMLHIAENKGCMEKQLHKCFEEIGLKREWFAHTERIDRFIEFVKSHKLEIPEGTQIYRPEPKFKEPIPKKKPNQLNAESIMPFGRHKGMLLKDVPTPYLKWLYKSGYPPKFKDYLSERLEIFE